MTPYVTVDDCVPQDLYICVRDQCSRTVASVKAKLHLMLGHTTFNYILTNGQNERPRPSPVFLQLCFETEHFTLMLLLTGK